MTQPATLSPEQVTAIVDTREQRPLDLSPLQSEVGTLDTGDYSIRGLEHVVRVERKSLDDLVACCGRERERFDREVQRLLSYPVRAIVVESDWPTIEVGAWRSSLKPPTVIGSLLGWMAMGLPVLMTGDHKRAGTFTGRILYTAARRRWREARSFVGSVNGGGEG